MASDVRQRILDAAVKVLIEQGGSALTQPKIAAAAGVRQSHLTYYFPRRNDLMLAVTLHWAHTYLAEAARKAGASPATLRDIARYMGEIVVEAARVRIFLSLIVSAAGDDPRIHEPLRELIASERQSVGTLLAGAGVTLDADGAAITHAALVGLAVLNVAQGRSADRQTRASVKAVLERLVPILASRRKPAAKRRRTRKRA